MRAKLTLNVEDLTVDSFDTTTTQKAKGTVFGEQCTCPTACTCPGCPSCDATCPATCANTCDDWTCAASCGDTCDGCTNWTECNCPQSCARTACGHSPCCA